MDSSRVAAALGRRSTKLRAAVREKMAVVLEEIKAKTLTGKPGMFISPSTIETEVGGTGYTVEGTLEATNKPGVYVILPSKARVLRFIAKSGELVHTGIVHHPFPKGTVAVERTLAELKPHIFDQLEDAVIEAL